MPASRRRSRLVPRAALIGAAVAFLVPFYVVVVTAFKPLGEIVGGDMLAPPAHWTVAAIQRAWSSACVGSVCEGVASGVLTSIWITLPAASCSVLLGAVSGYALTAWRLPGARLMFALLLAANLLPYQAVLLPMAITLRTLGLFGTPAGLILVHVVYGLPYTTLLFRNSFLAVPDEIVRAARMDGARFWGIFTHIMLPLARPMLALALALQVSGVWNDYLFGLAFGGRSVPVTVMVANLISSERGEKEYNVNMAAVLLAIVPVLLVYLFAGRLVMKRVAAAPVRP